jgi:hypothetical protein
VFSELDQRILGFYTKVSHAFQRLVGRTNFFLGAVGISVSLVELFARVYLVYKPLYLLTLAPFFAIYSQLAIEADDEFLENGIKRSDVAMKLWWVEAHFIFSRPFCRISILTANFFALISFLFGQEKICALWWLAGGIGYMSFEYFIDVTPLPQSKSLVRKAFDWLKNLLRPIPHLVPIPVRPTPRQPRTAAAL